MKLVKLEIADKEHEIAILLSKEEALQIKGLVGCFGDQDARDTMRIGNRGFKPLDKITNPKTGHKSSWIYRFYDLVNCSMI